MIQAQTGHYSVLSADTFNAYMAGVPVPDGHVLVAGDPATVEGMARRIQAGDTELRRRARRKQQQSSRRRNR